MGETRKTGVVFHLPQDWLAPQSDAMLPFYRKAIDGLEDLGVPCRLTALDRETVTERIDDDDWFHIINHGRVRHPRALNAGVAYIYPFWNLDPEGIRAFSSIGDKAFRGAKIDAEEARGFLDRLRRKWVVKRQSRYEQPETRDPALPQDATAVFFQSESHRSVDETCYMDRWQMLEACLAADVGPVVVKPHPRDLDSEMLDRLLAMQATHPHLHVSMGNIHDILARARYVVTINSAVGIEAYLHRKSVILCGKADFHHIAQTATDPDTLTTMLREPPAGRVYAKYLYWYFAMQCVDAGRPNLARQILRKIKSTGYRFD